MSLACSVIVVMLITITTATDRKTAELRFVNVVFRHGDRTPENSGMFPNDPYAYNDWFPFGPGGLTNEGKRRAYQLGELLRERYNKFLGDIYLSEDVVAYSSDSERTKMSLSLVLASLYPPRSLQIWHPSLNWQPIPITYQPLTNDVFLIPFFCTGYIEEYNRVKSLPEVIEKIENFRPLMKNLTIHTGQFVNDTTQLSRLYIMLRTEKLMGLKLTDWANDVLSGGDLFDALLLHYEILTYNDVLKRRFGGPLMKLFNDHMIATVNGTEKEAKKINLFSGHELNIMSILCNLGVYQPHVPEYTSAVIVELLQKDNDYYVKVLHYLGIPPKMTELTIPGCDELCPLEVYLKLVKNVTAQDDDLDCLKEN